MTIPVPMDLKTAVDVLSPDCPMTRDSQTVLTVADFMFPGSWQPLTRDTKAVLTEMGAPFRGPDSPRRLEFLRLSGTKLVHSYDDSGSQTDPYVCR